MKEVLFKFDVDDIVHVKKLPIVVGVVKMCSFDRGGISYYVTSEKSSEWWHEDQLASND